MKESTGDPQLSAREAVLKRIRTALAGTSDTPRAIAEPAYRRRGYLDRAACLELFIDRLIDYDAAITQVEDEAAIASAIAASLQQAGEQRVVVAAEFPQGWLPPGQQVVVDDAVSIAEIDGVDSVVTTCEVAVASTGTIILKHVGAQGRRVITLLPDHHICLVRRNQVVELLPEALALLDPTDPAPLTTISGPSATSDIEMTRVRGVHGPRRLTVILYGA
jgi:L-lactate dehydrogenase complex protein LldG